MQPAVGAAVGQVAAAVEAATRRAEGIGHEPGRGQLRPVEVATGDSRPSDVDLARHTGRDRPAVRVEQVDAQIRQRLPHRVAQRGVQILRPGRVVARMHRRLGDPVHVGQPGGGQVAPRHPRHQVGELQLLPGEHHRPHGQLVDPWIAGAGQCDQPPECRRGLVEHGHPVPDQQVQEVFRGPGDRGRHHHQGAAEQQGAPQLPHGDVEGVGVEQRPDVLVGEVVQLVPAGQQPHDVGVGDAHALGPAGGARGVDDVREIVRPGPDDRVGGRLVLPEQAIQQHHDDIGAEPAEPGPQVGGGDDDPGPGVADHVGQPIAGLGRVQRQVRGVGLEHAQQRRDQLGTTREAHADDRFRTGAEPAQVVRQPVRPAVELGVAEPAPRLAVDQDGRGVRARRYLGAQQLVQAARHRFVLHHGTGRDQPVQLVGAEDGQR